MKSKKKNSTKLDELDPYDLEGKVSDVIARLQKIVDQHPNAVIDYELDYSCCFYESDHPEPKFTVRSRHPKV